MRLSKEIVNLLQKQGFVVVSTLDSSGGIHCSAKGIAGIEEQGRVYLIDLYRARTFDNLTKNPAISITAVDERQFSGFTLKGKASIIEREKIKSHIIKSWEDKVIQRVSKRVIQDVQADKKSSRHPEAAFPHPQYLIEMQVEEAIDLTPGHLKSNN